MILKIFAVYDSAVEGYMSPFFMNARGKSYVTSSGEVLGVADSITEVPYLETTVSMKVKSSLS